VLAEMPESGFFLSLFLNMHVMLFLTLLYAWQLLPPALHGLAHITLC